MSELVGLDPHTLLRAAIFVGVLGVMMLWEVFAPRRVVVAPRVLRWVSNLGVSVLNRILIALIASLVGLGAALTGEQAGWGLFHRWQVPGWLVFAGSVVLLDLVVYLQHRVLHAVPWLWRLHRMHHADVELDATSGVRFHPFEALISLIVKAVAVLAIGAPAMAVLVFELLLNATSVFNHSNVRIPLGVDRVLRWVLVTPDMHRVHHSVRVEELSRNFGFNMPWWDRLFRTYRDQPADGHEHMTIGLEQFRSREEMRLDRMLVQPFKR